MDENTVLKLAIGMFVLAHFVVLTLRKRAPRLVPGLNALVAAGVLVSTAMHPHLLGPTVDWQLLGLAAFELVVLGVAVAAWRDTRQGALRPGGWPSTTFAALHLLAGAAALLLALTFKVTRMI